MCAACAELGMATFGVDDEMIREFFTASDKTPPQTPGGGASAFST